MDRSRRALLALAVTAFVIVPAVAFAAAPANDNFAAAIVVPAAGGTVTSSNVDATAEPGEPDHAGSSFGALHSVWFTWTAPADGAVALDTCGSGFNTRLGVYTGHAVRRALALFGPSRLMFGSDWPSSLPDHTWKESFAAFTQALGAQPIEVREELLGGTAARFYAL